MLRNHYFVIGNDVHIQLRRRTGPDLYAIIDRAQLPRLRGYRGRWSAMASNGTYYAKMTRQNEDGTDRTVYMHRLLAAAPDGVVVDHRNHNGLDNRSGNLRLGSESRNHLNPGRARSDSRSTMPNVRLLSTGQASASVKVFGQTINLGKFDRTEDAARAAKDFKEHIINTVMATQDIGPKVAAAA